MVDGKEYEFARHIVCVIDILGQKEKLSKWSDLTQERSKLKSAIAQTVGKVLKIKNAYKVFFEGIERTSIPQETLDTFSKEKHDAFRRVRDSRICDQQFSDTFVFYARTANSQNDAAALSLLGILAASCFTMQASLADNMVMRGGISIGAGVELEDHNFYGPALAEAYHLENKIAQYPRIVVSPKVVEFIKEIQEFPDNDAVSLGLKGLADQCNKLICADIDGYHIVDFLGKCYWELVKDAPCGPPMKDAYTFVRSEGERFRAAGDSKLALRYHLLQHYMESRLPTWGLNPKKM